MNYKKSFVTIVAAIIFITLGYLALHKLTPAKTSSIGNSSSSSVLQSGEMAPAFRAQTIDGQQFSLAAHKGKPVIVFAMFGGCGDCIPVGQTLSQIQSNFASMGVTVIAIDILKGEPTSVLEQYRSETKATFPLVSYDANVVNSYKLTAPEITYVIDKNGNIAFINQNALSYDQYKQQVEQAL